jgi:hypothetical protein
MALKRILLVPPPVETQAKLQKLAAVARTLNDLSDQLSQQVAEIEVAVCKLNLGVPASVIAETSSTENGVRGHCVRLAFDKHAGRWGFQVEELTENLDYPDMDEYQAWPFKDAPRDYRLKTVVRIPELLDALVTKSAEVASDITEKVGYAKQIAAALAPPSAEDSKKQESK